MAFYSLPMGKFNEKTRVKNLNNLPDNLKTSFYENWLENVDRFVDSHFQKEIISETPSEDVNKRG